METSLRIPGFTLERLIGEGGFGQVWLACRENKIGHVAIKVLHLELVRSIDALTRFQRELDAIQRLEHPNVVRALDHGTLSDGRPYIVLEYVAGPSLRDVIHERGSIPPAEMLEILEPLCNALGMAHAAGLVHRDVKASNVILAKDRDGKLRPVLLDFGLVKLLDEVGPGLTSSRSMLGTPAAMAPEQMRGQAVDPRTDVYALGLLAYHMLTGQPAFGGGPGVVQTYLQIHGSRPRPSAKVDIDPAIDEPITRALAPESDARFASAADFVAALRAVIYPIATPSTEVVALYVEADATVIANVKAIALQAGMIIALSAPDSMLAVVRRAAFCGSDSLRSALANAGDLHGALGITQAALAGEIVDGAALDVESWAPYPLASGLWVACGL